MQSPRPYAIPSKEASLKDSRKGPPKRPSQDSSLSCGVLAEALGKYGGLCCFKSLQTRLCLHSWTAAELELAGPLKFFVLGSQAAVGERA